jgi:hypothetical protein
VLSIATLLLGATARAQTNPIPIIYPLSPGATQPGGPAFLVTVNGTGFVSGAVVNWNGSQRPTTFVSNSQVSAAITDADIATPKTAVITVTNPAPGGGSSNQQNFQVTFRYDALSFQDSAVSTLSNVAKVLTGDFNGDGKPEVVALERLPDSTTIIQILLGNGDGTFQLPVTVSPMDAISVHVCDYGTGTGKAYIVAMLHRRLKATAAVP